MGFLQVYETWKWRGALSFCLFWLFVIIAGKWEDRNQDPTFLLVQLSPYTPSFLVRSLAALHRALPKRSALSWLQAHFILHSSHTELTTAPRMYSVLCWCQALYVPFSFWNDLPVLHSDDSYSSIISHLRCHFLQRNLSWLSKTRLRAASLYSYKDPKETNIELTRLHWFFLFISTTMKALWGQGLCLIHQ